MFVNLLWWYVFLSLLQFVYSEREHWVISSPGVGEGVER